MTVIRTNSIWRRGRRIPLGRMAFVASCEEPACEWFTATPETKAAGSEALLAHYRIVHPEKHAEKVWEILGVQIREAADAVTRKGFRA